VRRGRGEEEEGGVVVGERWVARKTFRVGTDQQWRVGLL